MRPQDTEVINTYIVMPPQTNVHGTAFGGQIMAWMDEVAAIAALRFCQKPCVTVSLDSVQFTKPIKMGHILIMKARVNYTGTTSMEIGVKVHSENPMTGIREHALTGYITFVAVDENGKPTNIPQLEIDSASDAKAYAKAERRRAARLAERKKENAEDRES